MTICSRAFLCRGDDVQAVCPVCYFEVPAEVRLFFSGAFSCRGDKARAVWPLCNFTSVDVNRLQLQQAASWCFMNWWCAHPFRRIHIRTEKNNEKTKQGHTANDAWYLHTVAQTLWISREEWTFTYSSRFFVQKLNNFAGWGF